MNIYLEMPSLHLINLGIFLFSFESKYFLISLTHGLFVLGKCYLISKYLDIFQMSFCYWFITSFVVRGYTLYDLNFYKCIKTCFMTHVHLKRMDILCFGSQSVLHCHSDAQLCPTLCDSMNCSMPGFSIHHYLHEFAQTCVHWVSDTIQPAHPLSSPSPPALNF